LGFWVGVAVGIFSTLFSLGLIQMAARGEGVKEEEKRHMANLKVVKINGEEGIEASKYRAAI
jgi:hypothetical protein